MGPGANAGPMSDQERRSGKDRRRNQGGWDNAHSR